MEPVIYLTIRYSGRMITDAVLAGFIRDSLNVSSEKPDLLCYCHQSTGPVWEAPCAKLRAGLGLSTLFPLAFGQSGCLSFPHAMALTEWLLAAGPHRGALLVIVERSEAVNVADEDASLHSTAIIEASLERGTYRVMRDSSSVPELCLTTKRQASEPFMELKDHEPFLAPGTFLELAFHNGSEVLKVILRKE